MPQLEGWAREGETLIPQSICRVRTCAWRDLYSLLVKSTAVVQTVWMQKGV